MTERVSIKILKKRPLNHTISVHIDFPTEIKWYIESLWASHYIFEIIWDERKNDSWLVSLVYDFKLLKTKANRMLHGFFHIQEVMWS